MFIFFSYLQVMSKYYIHKLYYYRVRIQELQKWVNTDIFWIEHDCLELHARHYFHTKSYLSDMA